MKLSNFKKWVLYLAPLFEFVLIFLAIAFRSTEQLLLVTVIFGVVNLIFFSVSYQFFDIDLWKKKMNLNEKIEEVEEIYDAYLEILQIIGKSEVVKALEEKDKEDYNKLKALIDGD